MPVFPFRGERLAFFWKDQGFTVCVVVIMRMDSTTGFPGF
jgi:hypothetical protein